MPPARLWRVLVVSDRLRACRSRSRSSSRRASIRQQVRTRYTVLHLPVSTVPTLHGVRRRSQGKLFIKEHQRLLQSRREQLLQHLTQSDKARNRAVAEVGQGRRRAAPANRTGDRPPPSGAGAELRLAAEVIRSGVLRWEVVKMMPDEQVAVLEKIRDLPLDPLLAAGGTTRLRAGTARDNLGAGPPGPCAWPRP